MRLTGTEVAGAAIQGGVIQVPVETDRRIAEGHLVRQAQAGDLAAFEQLYRENHRKVFALCMRLSSDATLAEELTQDVFVRAWQKLGSFRGESAFSSWLYPLAVNVTMTEWRARKRRTSRFLYTDDLAPFDTASETKRAFAGAKFDLEKAMATLPSGARAVFVLHDVEGYKHHEIAELLDMAVGTSKAQLHRARRLLREALAS